MEIQGQLRQKKSMWDSISVEKAACGGMCLSSQDGGKLKVGESRSRLAWEKRDSVKQPEQKGWRRGSSGKAPTLKVQSPKFKAQDHQKKKKIF
jgi:hypothetical protein